MTLEELEALVQLASPAPWKLERGWEGDDPGFYVVDAAGEIVVAFSDYGNAVEQMSEADLELIVAMRNQVAALLKRVHDAESYATLRHPRAIKEALRTLRTDNRLLHEAAKRHAEEKRTLKTIFEVARGVAEIENDQPLLDSARKRLGALVDELDRR
jgi:hypothetical protein